MIGNKMIFCPKEKVVKFVENNDKCHQLDKKISGIVEINTNNPSQIVFKSSFSRRLQTFDDFFSKMVGQVNGFQLTQKK